MATAYTPMEAIHLLRPAFRTARIPIHRSRCAKVAFSTSSARLATHSSGTNTNAGSAPKASVPTHRRVTIANDTGAVKWSELSLGEKAARTTQQSFNFGLIVLGVGLTGAVAYFLFSDVFSPNSKTAHFNRATDRIRASPECTALLGPGNQISAHGEASWSRWMHDRKISSSSEIDRWGTEHLRIRFYVEGPLNQGVVNVHMVRRPSQDEFEYQTLAVDVKGHGRVYLENADERKGSKVAPKIFGARWW